MERNRGQGRARSTCVTKTLRPVQQKTKNLSQKHFHLDNNQDLPAAAAWSSLLRKSWSSAQTFISYSFMASAFSPVVDTRHSHFLAPLTFNIIQRCTCILSTEVATFIQSYLKTSFFKSTMVYSCCLFV